MTLILALLADVRRGKTGATRSFPQAEEASSRYTGENIYILNGSAGGPLSMGERQLPDSVGSPVESFLSTVHFEENHLYSPLAIDGDHLFWSSLAGHKKQEFEIDLPKVAAGGGSLGVAVWGSTESPEQFDHHVVLSLNGQILVDEDAERFKALTSLWAQEDFAFDPLVRKLFLKMTAPTM